MIRKARVEHEVVYVELAPKLHSPPEPTAVPQFVSRARKHLAMPAAFSAHLVARPTTFSAEVRLRVLTQTFPNTPGDARATRLSRAVRQRECQTGGFEERSAAFEVFGSTAVVCCAKQIV